MGAGGEAGGIAPGSELAEGTGGTGDSPMLVNSGVAGFGTNIVFRTSLRPRRVFDRRAGGAACCR